MISLRDTAITAGIIALVCLLVYGGSLGNNFVHFDDNTLITDNPAVAHFSFSSVKHVFTSYDPELYIPLTLFSFQLEHLFFGYNPFVFHLTNLLLHTANAVLVFILLSLLGQKRWIAFAGALLFAIHPQNTEAVAWATGRKDVLATFFGLLSIVTYELSYERESRRLFSISIATFILGLLSKAVLIPLPVALILFDWYKKRSLTKKIILEKIPYVVLSILFALVALFGKQELLVETTFLQKILMAMKSTVFYLEKFFVPIDLTVIYPYSKQILLSSPDFFAPLLIVLALSAGALVMLRWTRVVLFGWLFFLVFLAPTFVNFSKGGALYFASDRYAYIPSIGLIIILTVSVSTLLRRVSSRSRIPEQAAVCVGVVLAILFGLAAREQSHTWRNSQTLFEHVLSLYSNSLLAHNNLANLYRDQGDTASALVHYEEAKKIDPKNAIIWNNIGITYRGMGKIEEAVQAYTKSMELKPDFADAPYNMGYLEYARGNKNEAFTWYRKALTMLPTHVRSRIGMSAIFSEQGDDLAALKLLAEGAQLQPEVAEFPYNTGVLLEKHGKQKEAKAMYLHALKLNPYYLNALNNLGGIAVQDGDYDGAKEYFRRALAINPHDTDVQQNLDALERL